MSKIYRVIPEEIFLGLVERGVITPEHFNDLDNQTRPIKTDNSENCDKLEHSTETTLVNKWIPFNQVFSFKKK